MVGPGLHQPRIIGRLAPILILAGLAGACPGPAAGFPGIPAVPVLGPETPEAACARTIPAIENAAGIPRHLLSAIALAESGRAEEGGPAMLAWPWTVNAEGEGRYFATKEEAVAAVRDLQARGIDSIDVGCMQVNLHHHADAFASIEEALDPAANVAYAARFLKALRRDKGSWSQAVGFYHSATRELNVPYRGKVYRLWAEVRRNEAERKRQEVIAAYLARRAAHRARAAFPAASSTAGQGSLPDPPS